jgi:ribosomal protein S18 acetylase RimI-like enzyme
MTEFSFTNDHTSHAASNVIDVLRSPRLWIPTERDYPDYEEWLLKIEAQIATGKKRAMLAHHDGKGVGAIVYGEHATEPKAINIKNISIAPNARGRYIGSFMLRNTEVEAVDTDFAGTENIFVDTKPANSEMLAFLGSHGYHPVGVTDLYGLGTGPDVILKKSVR